MQGSTFRNLLLSLGGGASRKISSFVVSVILAHRLQRSSFGYLVLSLSLTAILIGLADAGQRALGWREVATRTSREGIDHSVLQATLVKATSAAIVWLVLTIVAYALVRPRAPVFAAMLLSSGLLLAFNETSFDWILAARQRFAALSTWLASGAVIEIAFVALWVTADTRAWLAPVAIAASYALPAAALLTPSFLRAWRSTWREAVVAVPMRIKRGFPLATGAILFRLAAQLSVVLTGVALSPEATADYRVAQIGWVFLLWASLTMVAPMFSTIAQLPRVAGSGATSAPYALAAWAGLVMRTFTLAALAGIAVARSAVSVVFGERYESSGAILAALLVSLPAASANAFLREGAASAHRDTLAAKSGTAVVLVTILLLIPAARLWGVVAIPAVVVLAETLGLLAALADLRAVDAPTRAEAAALVASLAVCTVASVVQLAVIVGSPASAWLLPLGWGGYLALRWPSDMRRLHLAKAVPGVRMG